MKKYTAYRYNLLLEGRTELGDWEELNKVENGLTKNWIDIVGDTIAVTTNDSIDFHGYRREKMELQKLAKEEGAREERERVIKLDEELSKDLYKTGIDTIGGWRTLFIDQLTIPLVKEKE